jgi:DNA polymerase-3 subunit epsilon
MRNYRWSDGTDRLPKSGWICLPNELLADEKRWLDETIYGASGASDSIPQYEITA